MTVQTETKADTEAIPDQWPPVAHIVKTPFKEGDTALCGAKIMGVPLPEGTKVCEKCRLIWVNWAGQ